MEVAMTCQLNWEYTASDKKRQWESAALIWYKALKFSPKKPWSSNDNKGVVREVTTMKWQHDIYYCTPRKIGIIISKSRRWEEWRWDFVLPNFSVTRMTKETYFKGNNWPPSGQMQSIERVWKLFFARYVGWTSVMMSSKMVEDQQCIIVGFQFSHARGTTL